VELLDAEPEDPVDPLLDAFERRFPETAKKLDKWLVRPRNPGRRRTSEAGFSGAA
jgi:hypothetical protein